MQKNHLFPILWEEMVFTLPLYYRRFTKMVMIISTMMIVTI